MSMKWSDTKTSGRRLNREGTKWVLTRFRWIIRAWFRHCAPDTEPLGTGRLPSPGRRKRRPCGWMRWSLLLSRRTLRTWPVPGRSASSGFDPEYSSMRWSAGPWSAPPASAPSRRRTLRWSRWSLWTRTIAQYPISHRYLLGFYSGLCSKEEERMN